MYVFNVWKNVLFKGCFNDVFEVLEEVSCRMVSYEWCCGYDYNFYCLYWEYMIDNKYWFVFDEENLVFIN